MAFVPLQPIGSKLSSFLEAEEISRHQEFMKKHQVTLSERRAEVAQEDLARVVEEPLDILSLERTRAYKGLYHVLHGTISPASGIGPENLKIRELLDRLKQNTVTELILATNPSLEGESTAMYIHKLLSPVVNRITRLARGLPVGSDLEYADEVTLGRALEGRQEI